MSEEQKDQKPKLEPINWNQVIVYILMAVIGIIASRLGIVLPPPPNAPVVVMVQPANTPPQVITEVKK